MRRFFISAQQRENSAVILTGSEAHHLANVLRLQAQDQVEFIDGSGRILVSRLERVTPNKVEATVVEERLERVETPFPITLLMGVLKGKKMELVIQKATELGVHQVLPVHTRFCAFQAQGEKQQRRWQRIMVEACKQCKRTQPMSILPITRFEQVDFSQFTHKVVGWEKEHSGRLTPGTFHTPGPVCIGIGPEGGWHENEITHLLDKAFLPVTLGPHILRGETAAIAATAIVQNMLRLNADT